MCVRACVCMCAYLCICVHVCVQTERNVLLFLSSGDTVYLPWDSFMCTVLWETVFYEGADFPRTIKLMSLIINELSC